MKICFIMYPWKNIEPETDSILRLIHEAVSREHTVAITTPHNLTIRDSVTSAFCSVIKNYILTYMPVAASSNTV
jgi:glutathione synthase